MMRVSRLRLIVFVLGVGLFSTLLGASRMTPHHSPARLANHGPLPDFSLIDQGGEPVNLSRLKGSVWIANFIFTRCAGQCPLMSAQMATLYEALRDVPSIQFISFSVDPSYDTPERLASYARSYGVHDERWRFVTEADTTTSIAQLAQQGFRLGVSADGTQEETPPLGGGDGEARGGPPPARGTITHSVRLVLVDSHGSIRGYYDATDAQAMAHLHTDARRLARERR